MIKSLKIKNIQGHKNSFLEFDPGVSVIIGGSDQGKSAIFNSLYWTIYNRPLGEQHRSWDSLGWKGPMSSEIELEEGVSIKLERDKQSIYTINNDNEKQLSFKAFGQDPPQEITKIFNINRKINIQQQLEKGVPIFLISESPGDVAKHFNKVAGLYKIDTTIETAKKDVNKTTKELKIIKTQIKDKKEELKYYSGLNELKKFITQAKIIEKEIQNESELKFELSTILDKINQINSTLIIKKEKLKLKNFIKDGLLLYNRVKEQENWVKHKTNKLEDINIKKDKLNILNKKYTLKPLIDKCVLFNGIHKEYNKEKYKLQELIHIILKTKDKIKGLSTKKDEINFKFKSTLPEYCPICGGDTSLLSDS